MSIVLSLMSAFAVLTYLFHILCARSARFRETLIRYCNDVPPTMTATPEQWRSRHPEQS